MSESKSLETKILEVLSDLKEPIDTLEVSKKIFGKSGTQKMVNPTLYNLQKKEFIIRTTKEGTLRPYWSIKQPELS